MNSSLDYGSPRKMVVGVRIIVFHFLDGLRWALFMVLVLFDFDPWLLTHRIRRGI